jgi:DMSO/TMAO reductase YedYZ molybdopterin-dependent catalytic subunit
MNGAELPASHGFPLRAVVPGWYAMASVKWLTRIVVMDRPFHGYYQSFEYTRWEDLGGAPTLKPLTEIEPKAQIARPARHEAIPRNSSYRVHGAAWAGESEVRTVEVSTDGGKTWAAAQLLDKPARYAWRRWQYDWQSPAAAGQRSLAVRAADSRGKTQPAERDPRRRNYAVNHLIPVEVEIR